MNASFSEILNSQLNSLTKNLQVTENLLEKCIENALSKDGIDFNKEEALLEDMLILKKLVYEMSLVRWDHLETCSDITYYIEKNDINSVEIVTRVINEFFDHYQCSWDFVVSVFVLIDILVWKEDFLGRSCRNNYVASVNSGIKETLKTTIGHWVFFNGGWSKFLSEPWSTQQYGKILRQMYDFIKTL